MSKKLARLPESYENEMLVLELVPALLTGSGFSDIRMERRGQVKLISATTAKGDPVRFWLKVGWTGTQHFCAVQFGLFTGEQDTDIPDARFLKLVDLRVTRVKALGATHALLVHMASGVLRNWVTLTMDGMAAAYHEQLATWPVRARKSKSPTLWFEETRNRPDADCVSVVTARDLDLSSLAAGQPTPALSQPGPSQGPASKTVTVEVERRLKQAAFRQRLGTQYGWRCMVSGTTVKAALDAAHLPGRNWRMHNTVTDGILLRADLHRLLDAGLANIEAGCFVVAAPARVGEYASLHGTPLPHAMDTNEPVGTT
ncbi:HNH endonuclease signature motif containing protein [Cupriavidus sp. WS]|uniref:HNH endonuclease signature motif containing protein n=1 Tax=Cupriavidus sp. WS TaxID=1312922 RepID=UPI0003810B31|nr:HNH endonuclease signature motif containing protein [Cupriavidus sp. WS]